MSNTLDCFYDVESINEKNIGNANGTGKVIPQENYIHFTSINLESYANAALNALINIQKNSSNFKYNTYPQSCAVANDVASTCTTVVSPCKIGGNPKTCVASACGSSLNNVSDKNCAACTSPNSSSYNYFPCRKSDGKNFTYMNLCEDVSNIKSETINTSTITTTNTPIGKASYASASSSQCIGSPYNIPLAQQCTVNMKGKCVATPCALSKNQASSSINSCGSITLPNTSLNYNYNPFTDGNGGYLNYCKKG